ncbi:MAG: ferritin family protein [Acidobacteria bacterium]|nr:ferritin family protein [Acidobacteriota bacterium]
MPNEIIAALRDAMKNEMDGYHFYLMAAETMKDSKGKELFKILAEEELMHLKFLEANYKSLHDTGKISPTAKLGDKHLFDGENPLFSDSIRDRIGDAHFEMTALSIAINLELNTIKHYKGYANHANDPEVRKFLEELVEWETGHYDALLKQDEALKEEYWEAAGFAPY